MAEINIEKKKTIWPWVLAAIILLLALLYFFVLSGDDDDAATDDVTTEEVVVEEDSNSYDSQEVEDETTGVVGAIGTYTSFVGETGEMGIDHEYSNQALIYLIDAVDEKAEDLNTDIEADLSEARQNAERITKDPSSLIHADKLKEAFTIINNAIGTIQEQNFPQMSDAVEALQQDVNEIDAEDQTLNQKSAFNAYFKKAADVLNQMQ